MRQRLQALADEMVDGHILLSEALSEFEKIYILTGLAKNNFHLSRTAKALGIHRNTLSKRVASYQKAERAAARAAKAAGR